LRGFKSQPKGWQRARMAQFPRQSCPASAACQKIMVGDRWTDFWCRFISRIGGEARFRRPAFHPGVVMQEVDYEKMEEIRARVEAIGRLAWN
jgi:hypothetical protein